MGRKTTCLFICPREKNGCAVPDDDDYIQISRLRLSTTFTTRWFYLLVYFMYMTSSRPSQIWHTSEAEWLLQHNTTYFLLRKSKTHTRFSHLFLRFIKYLSQRRVVDTNKLKTLEAARTSICLLKGEGGPLSDWRSSTAAMEAASALVASTS